MLPEFVRNLERENKIVRVKREADPGQELAAVLTGDAPAAVIFEKTRD